MAELTLLILDGSGRASSLLGHDTRSVPCRVPKVNADIQYMSDIQYKFQDRKDQRRVKKFKRRYARTQCASIGPNEVSQSISF